jgi:rubrerythrin
MDKLDLLNIALRIESTGYEGYKKMAERSNEEAIKSFFERLAQQEREHYETFRDIFKNIESKEELRNWADEEALGYWQSYAQLSIFPRIANNQMPESYVEALDQAIESEKDSIIFYNGIKEYFSGKEEIQNIIKEEQIHLMDLLTLKK